MNRKWKRVKVTKKVFVGMGRTEVATWTEYQLVLPDGSVLGEVCKTGTHLDDYPWNWSTSLGDAGNTGLLGEAKQEVEDSVDGKRRPVDAS